MSFERDYDDFAPKPPESVGDRLWRKTAEYRLIFRLTLPTQVFWFCVYIFAFWLIGGLH